MYTVVNVNRFSQHFVVFAGMHAWLFAIFSRVTFNFDSNKTMPHRVGNFGKVKFSTKIYFLKSNTHNFSKLWKILYSAEIAI